MNDSRTAHSRTHQISKRVVKNYIHHLFTPDSLSIVSEINFKENLKLLDVGCKNGKLLFKLASYCPDCELHGLDIDARKISKNESKNKYSNVHFHCAAAENMPFENNYFDVIVCTNALHHFPQRVRALDEMYRVLKTGGELFLLEGINNTEYKNRFDKTLRQSKFIRPQKKLLPRTALFYRSYFIHYVKQ